MAKEWTDEEVQAEIRAAVEIVRADREKARYLELHGKYGQTPTDPPNPSGGTDPPPPKNDGGDPPKKGRRSLWWGDRLDESA